MSFSLQQLTDILQGTLINRSGHDSATLLIHDVASLPVAQSGQLTYAESSKQVATLKTSQAGAVITNQEVANLLPEITVPLIIVGQPQKLFIDAMLLLRAARSRTDMGVSGRAIVDPTARIGAECRIAAGAIIGKRVQIGERCEIGAGAVIGDDCCIGDDCIVYPNAVLYAQVQLKSRVIVHANAVLGADGFGYRFVQGNFIKIPHTGTVILEDDVEIGAGTTIDRGMIESTVIGQGTKIDNQVMIGHNCRIGRNNAFASQVGLAGSVSTGDYVQMGGQVGIADHVHIATKVNLGPQAGILSDMLEPGTYLQTPAVRDIDAMKNVVNIRRIPELRNQIKQLAQQIAALEAQLSQTSPTVPLRSAA